MNKAYFETLPKDYFGGLYDKIAGQLTKGENVCISVIPGFGEKTIFNYLNYNLKKDKLFHQIFVFDPEIENNALTEFADGSIAKYSNKGNLLIVRFFEQIENKTKILEKLDSIRRKNPKHLVYLVISNQEAFVNPSSHQAATTVFFSELIYILPFDLVQTKKMIESLISYYGWRINQSSFNEIYKLSGGIPRLIKYLTKELYESRIPLTNKDRLISIPQVAFQLNFMAKILITYNRKHLILLGLTNEKHNLKSSLLKYYLRNFNSDIIAKLYPQLGETETKILSFFSENESQIVSLDNIADLMKMTDDSFSLYAIYKTISRLKPKIKNNFNIENIKGRGYRLIKVGV